MKLSGHIIASVPVGIISYSVTKSLPATAVSILAHIFIDLDHVLDYIFVFKRIPSIKKFFSYYHDLANVKTAYYIFHSWELMLLLTVLQFVYFNNYFFSLWLGLVTHMVVDQIWNGRYLDDDHCVHKYFYFMFHRWRVKFDHSLLRRGSRLK